jgi:protein-S-isoprenylcysteine O-methyltransferase Ste14
MLSLIRQLLAVAILPFSVTVLVPLWIGSRFAVSPAWPGSAGGWLLAALGAAVLAPGLLLFATTLWRFAREGKGTLAPWDPPQRLVVRGPYRYVRNPMISGVIAVLLGEALLLRSAALLTWAGIFLALNLVYIPLVEEPQLARRFGADYRRYREHVPGLLPRLRPWTGDDRSRNGDRPER